MKTKIFWAALLAVMCVTLTACHTVCDARGSSDFCEIHHSLMRTDIITNHKWPMPSQDYLVARSHLFIHAYPFMLPEKCSKCAVFICDDCVRAEEKWKQTH